MAGALRRRIADGGAGAARRPRRRATTVRGAARRVPRRRARHGAPRHRRAAQGLGRRADRGQRLPRRVRHRGGARGRRRHRRHGAGHRRVADRGPGGVVARLDPDDVDALAGAVTAGHVIECGAHATGGNFSGFRTVPGMVRPGFPIAEVAADGSSVITKHARDGGAVTVDTVTAQLLYEIQGPRYLNPDATVHLDTVQLSDRRGRTGWRSARSPGRRRRRRRRSPCSPRSGTRSRRCCSARRRTSRPRSRCCAASCAPSWRATSTSSTSPRSAWRRPTRPRSGRPPCRSG